MKQRSNRAALYARFSSDLQRDRSIEDQIALCQTFAEREGLEVVATFSDRARSGASVIGRDGLLDMMAAAKTRAFDVVIVEALDRLSRDQEDLASLYKRLTFAGVEIRAVHDGTADHVQIGVRGLLGQLFLQDLAHKTRRGMAGAVRDGRTAGGRSYGYRAKPGAPGEWEIVEEEAAVVRRIFAEYLAGKSPRQIAHGLNRDRIPSPRGGTWNGSSINGNAGRGHGILTNPMFDGRIVWNRVRMVRDPDTGRRVNRPNPESEWQWSEAPHLRIVEPQVFAAVQARKGGRVSAVRGEPQVKTYRLLSGLLRCGCCGGSMIVGSADKTGPRVRCAKAHDAGTCDHRKRYSVKKLERMVVEMVRRALADPEAVAAYVEGYLSERRAAIQAATRNRATLERRLATVQGEIDRLLTAHLKGLVDEAAFEARTLELRQDRAEAEAALAVAGEREEPIDLHPVALDRYRRDIATLDARLTEEPDPEVMLAFRTLVEAVIVRPVPEYGKVDVEVRGRLAALLGEDLPPAGRSAFPVVAGGGIEPPT